MAYSYVTYTGDGSTQIYTVPFPFIKQEDIHVFLDAEEVPTERMEWLSEASIKLDAPPEQGAIIRIRRDTDKEEVVVDFHDGSVLSEEDLDQNTRQLLFIAQEAYDALEGSPTIDNDNKWDMRGLPIKNVGPAEDPDDAITYRQYSTDMLPTLQDLQQKTAQSETQAKASETAAKDSEINAKASEESAAESVRQTEALTERARAWAESPTPPDPDDPESKSAKAWAKAASDTVPIATPATAGKVKPQTGDDDGLELDADGTLRVRQAGATQRGSVLASTTAQAGAVPVAGANGKIGRDWMNTPPVTLFNTRIVITESSAAWTPPVTGWARVTVIGGGGAGTSWLAGSGNQLAWGTPGGNTTFGDITARGGATSRALPNSATIAGRYRVGGGCAGEVITNYILLDKNTPINVTVGAGGIAGAGTSTSGYTGNPGSDTVNDSVGSSQQAWGGNGGRTGLGYGGGGGACGLTWGAESAGCNPHSPGYGHDGGENAIDAPANPQMGGDGGQGAVIIEYYDPDKEDA